MRPINLGGYHMTCKHLAGNKCTNAEAPTFNRHLLPTVCAGCTYYDGPSRGLGDTVHTVLEATGVHRIVKSCGGCAARRQALNEKFPSSANAGIDETPK
jgi:hypothetical protein